MERIVDDGLGDIKQNVSGLHDFKQNIRINIEALKTIKDMKEIGKKEAESYYITKQMKA